MTPRSERQRALRDAETKAEALFAEVEARELIQPGKTEKQLNTEMYELALEMFGIRKYWHKRIVRAGENTLSPYRENPPNLLLQEDEILFFDFGPVFEEWEADFGRTYVLGSDPEKLRIRDSIEQAWSNGAEYFHTHPKLSGADLFRYVSGLAREQGYEYGQQHCGHLIGNFPHEKIQGEEVRNYLHPENGDDLRTPDGEGRERDWILEVHFVDREKKIGGFFEQLLTVP